MALAEIVTGNGDVVGTVKDICDADAWCAAYTKATGACHMVRWYGELMYGYYIRGGELRRVIL